MRYKTPFFLVILTISTCSLCATKITFQSDIPFSKKEFFYLTELRQDRPATPEQIEYAIEQLKRKRRFDTIKTTVANDERVHFVLAAHWMFKKLSVSGVWFGKHTYENLYLQHPGEIFDITLHEQALSAIKDLLHQNGYFSCSIQDELLYNKKEKSITVKIRIEKNKRARIDQIEVKIAQPELAQKLYNQLSSLLLYKRYSKKILLKAKDKIKTFLKKQGFLKNTISLQRCIKNKGRRVGLLFKITTGKKQIFTFLNTRFSVNLDKPDWLLDPNIIAEQLAHTYYQHGFLQAQIHYKKIAPHHYQFKVIEGSKAPTKKPTVKEIDKSKEEKLAQERIAILERYQKEGFWYVDVRPKLDGSGGWHITPGERVTFGKVFLRSNTRLPFNRIMKEIAFKPGDPWDKKKLDYSRERLKKLDVFKHIEINPEKISDQQSKKPIVLTLIDDDPFELKLRSGYFLTSKNFLLKRESTYKLGGSLFIKNPLNLADKLSFVTNVTRFEKNIDFCYQVPFSFHRLKLNAYYHKYIHPLEVGKSDSAYEAVQNGILVGITKEYKNRSFWGITVGNEWMRTSRARGNLKLSSNMINTTIPYFFIEPTLLIDYLDDKINTTKGSLTFCSIKMMLPQTNRSATFKIMLDHSHFHHFGKKFVGAIRIRWGHIFRERFEEIMPIERFFLGGPLSVRGYSKDTVPPLGKTNNCKYTIQGGSSMINGNIELRFPIYKAFGGVIFQDVGALGQNGFCNFASWAPTSGWGLRYQTPIGALRFDIGWKWKKSFPTDTRYAWYLTLGQAF